MNDLVMPEQSVKVVVFHFSGAFDAHEVLIKVDFAVGEAEGGCFAKFRGGFPTFILVLA